jgi:hypothetical protein
MSEFVGKWVQAEGQPYEGLWFEFKKDGTFEAQYEPMGIVSSGTYETNGNKITMQQTFHTLGMVGEFKGLFSIEDELLKMALASGPGGERPTDLEDARIYTQQ